jgi:hypothetical protein
LRTKNRNSRPGGKRFSGSDYRNHYDHDHESRANTLNNRCPNPSNTNMNKYVCLLIGAALLAACEQKETTVTNPPAEKKESNTTIVNPSPATSTKTETKTDINVNTSPSP